jgi:CDP-diacylglycerol--serine O-phosphatidyltransferase
VPRAPWRRRSNDSPRPAGRRWTGRLRRGGSLARQALLVRVVRRRRRIVSPDRRQPYTVGTTRLSDRADTARVLIESVPVSPAPAGAATMPAAGAVPRTIPLMPGEQTMARRVKFGVANGCTLASLMLGLTAIFLSMHHDVRFAAVTLLGCVIFDGLDGALARRLGVASPFGAQMDSLVDMCSFGIAAPVVVYSSMSGRAPAALVAAACAMIAAGAAIRLARFNVSPKDGRFFCGVPTTMTAAVMGLSVLIGLRLPGPVAVVSIAMLAVAMVSGFPYAKLARVAKLPPWFWVAPLVGFFIDPRITFALLVAAYVVSGPLLWLRQRNHLAA